MNTIPHAVLLSAAGRPVSFSLSFWGAKALGIKQKKPALSRAKRKNTTDCLQTNNNVCNVGNPTSYPFGYAQKINYKGIILLYIDFVKAGGTKYRFSSLFAEKQEGQACLLVKGQAGKQALCCTLKKE